MGRSTSCHVLVELEDAGLAFRRMGGFVGVRRQFNRWYPLPVPEAVEDREGGEDLRREEAGGDGAGGAELPSLPAPGESVRLRRGELRGLILDYLRARPSQALTPTVVCRALDRSAGATANALTALTGSGLVMLVNAKPRMYQAVVQSSER